MTDAPKQAPAASPSPPPISVPPPPTTHGSTPSDFLSAVIGRPVIVKLNNGGEYRGILVCLDGYMNVALEQTEQYENGQLKHSFGDAFIRGNNVFYVATSTSNSASHASAKSYNINNSSKDITS